MVVDIYIFECGCVERIESYIMKNLMTYYIIICSFLFASWAGHATCFLNDIPVNKEAGIGLFLARFGAGPFYILIPFEILAISYGFQTILQSKKKPLFFLFKIMENY